MQRPIGGKDGAHVPPDGNFDWRSSSSAVSSFILREPSPFVSTWAADPLAPARS